MRLKVKAASTVNFKAENTDSRMWLGDNNVNRDTRYV